MFILIKVFSCRYFTLFIHSLMHIHDSSNVESWRKWKIPRHWKVMLSALHCGKGWFQSVCSVLKVICVYGLQHTLHILIMWSVFHLWCFRTFDLLHVRVAAHSWPQCMWNTFTMKLTHTRQSAENEALKEKSRLTLHLRVKHKDVFVLTACCTWTAIILFFNELWLDSHWTVVSVDTHGEREWSSVFWYTNPNVLCNLLNMEYLISHRPGFTHKV